METENIPPGQSAQLKVNLKPGAYELYCSIDGHEEQGMEESVRVAVKGGARSTGGSGDGSDDSGGGY